MNISIKNPIIVTAVISIAIFFGCGPGGNDERSSGSGGKQQNSGSEGNGQNTGGVAKSKEELAREGIMKIAKLVQDELSDSPNFKYGKVDFTAEKTDKDSIVHRYEGSVKYSYIYIEGGEEKAEIKDIMWLDFDDNHWEFDRFHKVSNVYGLGQDVKEINDLDKLPSALKDAYKKYREELNSN